MSGSDKAKSATPTFSKDEFVITRTFDAPRELVWKAHSEVERVKQWWGPKGSTVVEAKMDFRPGGACHYCLRSPDWQDMWGRIAYREIVAPTRIVGVVSFTDAKGTPARHPMSPNWPLHILSTWTFTEHDGKTTITVRWLPYEATDLERETFEQGRESMRMGWTGTLDRLEAYLARG